MKAIFSIGAAALVSAMACAPALSHGGANEPILLVLTVVGDNKVIGSPRLGVIPGKESSIGYEQADGSRFDGRFAVIPFGEDRYRVKMDLTFHSPTAGKQHFAPAVTVMEGHATSFRAGSEESLYGVDVAVEPAGR